MLKSPYKCFCSLDFFLILLNVRDIWVGLHKSAIAQALVDVAIPLLEDMG